MWGDWGSKQVCAPVTELKKLSADIDAVQENHFICDADCRVLEKAILTFSQHMDAAPALVSLC